MYQVYAAIVGAAAVVVLQAIRHWFVRPVLSLEFVPNHPAYLTDTAEGPHGNHEVVTGGARYLRVQVRNKRTAVAKACRAYLINVEKWDDTRLFRSTIYCDSLRLNWSAQPEQEKSLAFDLPHGVSQFVDVLSTREASPHYRLEVRTNLRRYLKLFREHGVLRFKILVTADNAKPQTISVAFQWSGKWDDVKTWRGHEEIRLP